jgi:hypothetical protein
MWGANTRSLTREHFEHHDWARADIRSENEKGCLEMKKLRARDGHNAGPQKAAAAQPQESPALMPLDFALTFMRDDAKPDALRVSTAKLAASLLPKPAAEETLPADEQPQAEQQSDLEIARRIAHILGRRHNELREKELMAQGWDVEKRGMPMDNTPWPAFLKRIMESL